MRFLKSATNHRADAPAFPAPLAAGAEGPGEVPLQRGGISPGAGGRALGSLAGWSTFFLLRHRVRERPFFPPRGPPGGSGGDDGGLAARSDARPGGRSCGPGAPLGVAPGRPGSGPPISSKSWWPVTGGCPFAMASSSSSLRSSPSAPAAPSAAKEALRSCRPPSRPSGDSWPSGLPIACVCSSAAGPPRASRPLTTRRFPAPFLPLSSCWATSR